VIAWIRNLARTLLLLLIPVVTAALIAGLLLGAYAAVGGFTTVLPSTPEEDRGVLW
jgi:hypothetical protein